MIGTNARDALAAGQTLLGWFHVANQGNVSPGTIRWTPTGGVEVELVEPVGSWPDLDAELYTVHGELRDGGDVTLLDTWTKRVALVDKVTALRASTLALGEWTEPDELWPRSIYSTANLSEWRADTGLAYDRPQPGHFRVDWRPPTRDDVVLRGMTLAFTGRMDTRVAYAAHCAIETMQVVIAEPEQPWSIDSAHRLVAIPLLDLMSFVSDRPDGLVREIMFNEHEKRRIEIWRRGEPIRPREWNPVRGFCCVRAISSTTTTPFGVGGPWTRSCGRRLASSPITSGKGTRTPPRAS